MLITLNYHHFLREKLRKWKVNNLLYNVLFLHLYCTYYMC